MAMSCLIINKAGLVPGNVRLCLICAACITTLCIGGCGLFHHSGPVGLSMASLTEAGGLDRRGNRFGLPMVELSAGSGRLAAEVARTPLQAATGLMYRARLAPDGAMLFVNSAPQRVAFHMKDTRMPLSCAFIDSNGAVLEIYAMLPGNEKPVVSASDDVRFVLEVNRGWLERHGVAVGSRINVAE